MSAVTTSSKPREMIRQQVRERHLDDQVTRALVLFLLTLTTVVYVAAPLQAARWFKLPYAGFLLDYPAAANVAIVRQPFLAHAVPDTQPGSLSHGESLLAADGVPINHARDFNRVLGQHQPGDAIAFQVQTPSGEVRTVNSTLQFMPFNVVLPLFAVPYVVGLAYLAAGLWVYLRRRDHVVGRVFLMLCTTMALVLGMTFDLWTTHTFSRLWAALVPWSAGMLLTFGLVFPRAVPPVVRRPALRWLPAVPTLALIVVTQSRLHLAQAVVDRQWTAIFAYAGLAVALFCAVMLARGLFAVAPAEREQGRLVLAAAILAFMPLVLRSTQLVAIPTGWALVALLLLPVVLAYAIIQYSMLDTNQLASFTTTYAIMAAIVTAGYALIVSGVNVIANALFGRGILPTNPILIGLLTFGLVLGFQPLRNRLHAALSARFFRSQAVYQDRLTEFRHQLTLVSGLAEVVRLLKHQIREGLMPTHTYVFLRDAQTGQFAAAGEGIRPDTDIRFEPQSGLVHALSTTRDVIFLEFNRPLPPELVEDHARLAILRTPVLVPLQGQERLAGWVAVGSKRSGEPFYTHDLRFIQGLAEQASLAVERAQVIGDLERRVRELDVLSQVAQAVNFTTDPDALLELIYAQTSKLIDTTNFYIIMHNPDLRRLRYAFFLEGDERYEQREDEAWPDTEDLASEVVRTGRPIRTHDYMAECNRRGVTARHAHLYAWMGVPLNSGTRTLGVMAVASYTQGVVFTEDQLKVFWAIADQAATALDKARLFNETETRARQLATLNEISKELSSTLDLENLLGRIMRAAVDMLGTEAGSLLLVDGDSADLVFRVVAGDNQNLVGTRLPQGVGIAGEAVETKQPVIVNDVQQDAIWQDGPGPDAGVKRQSLLAVPMLIQDESIGVLEVINRRDGLPFDDDAAALLTTFAAQAAVAIENARLYEATDAELARRVDELQTLQRIDRELNTTLQLDRVTHITLDWATRVTGAARGLVGLLNADDSGLEILSSSGYSQDFLEEYREKPFPIDSGVIGRVMESGQPEFVQRMTGDPGFDWLAEEQPAVQIAVPLLRAGRAVGVLVLESDDPGQLTMQDFDFAQRLVEHAAVAIDNARLVQEVQDANRSKTEFISFVAHELKNPMTSIRGYTDLIKTGATGPVNEMQGQFLSTIRSNVDRMSRLVSDLADVARIESGQLRVDMEAVTVANVVEETLRGLQAQIEEKNQELVIDVPDDLPPIYADRTRIVQVLTNLVSNAQKYTPEDGTIQVGARVEEATDEQTGQVRQVVHHWVRDTGIGMSEEDMEKLFTKFFRAQRGKDMASGTGLGLNITKNLIEWHGGSIWVESKVGEGSTFHYTIPVFVEGQIASED